MLSGKLALVTGGGSGIGRAICEKFARLGASVIVTDVKKKSAEETVSLLASNSNTSHTGVHCDVSGAEFVAQLRNFVIDEYKRAPSILVNNAGITMDSRLHKMSVEQFDWVINVNLKGTFLMSQAFTQAMLETDVKEGSVINMSSIVGKLGNFGQTNYAASKAGVIGLTKSIARELGPKGIRVNAILPGFIQTPMTEKMPDKVLDMMLSQIPIGRLGVPEDIADVCVFLGSDMSRYITGTCIEVTGGLGM